MPDDAGANSAIRIRGARVHNLRDVDVDIPRDRLVVITGVSGSGKSSLAFDTLFAEGQRQYVESLSAFARQFFDQLPRPDVDRIDGLQPTISIDQRRGIANPRSTVGTVTEIYDYLRLLFARLGAAECYQCGRPITQQSAEEIEQAILRLPERTKLILLAPMVRGRRGRHEEVFAAIRKAGLVRVRVDGELVDIDSVPELAPRRVHTIEAVVDRLIVREGIESRLAESIRLALHHGLGALIASWLETASGGADAPKNAQTWHDALYNTLYACAHCQISYEELETRTFSFNSPQGACPECEGLGTKIQFDPELVLPDVSLSLAEGAIAPCKGATSARSRELDEELARFCSRAKIDVGTPLSDYSATALDRLLRGDGRGLVGVLALLEKQYATATVDRERNHLERFRGEVPCNACGGSRLRPEARNVRVGGQAIHEVTAMPICRAAAFLKGLEFSPPQQLVAATILSEIHNRLEFLSKVGLDYLSLDRPAETLSGGELQRVRLGCGIGSGLVGVCYVLDEPSIGLHPRDNDRLIAALCDLKALGNTVVVVEHDEAIMRRADRLIDVGPGAGRHGGQIIAQGTPEEVARNEASVTGAYLNGQSSLPVPTERRRVAKTRAITIGDVTTHNLKNVTVAFPMGVFTCVTGVSGSGKSSLVHETFARALARRLGAGAPKPGPHGSLRGVRQIDRLMQIDQTPIGRTPRSNPATYCGVFDEIRKLFAATRQAKQFGFRASRFSFNVKGGRCEACQGQGQQRIEMNFLPDLYVPCAECVGRRFNRQTLAVRYRNRSIADVLEMPIDEAAELFENVPAALRMLVSLQQVGLGYLALGQPSTTLSGGEAQRVKLATELGRVETGSSLYLLDEPTTGLHFADIHRLLGVLGALVDRGNTVVVVEHHLDVIKTADWVIDLGPEGGEGGGYVVATGTPEQIAAVAESHTGRHLRPVLGIGAQTS